MRHRLIFFVILVAVMNPNRAGLLLAQETDRLTSPLITSIEIRGNTRIESSTIRARMKFEEGRPFSPEQIPEEIRAIYRMGYFENVQVGAEPSTGGVTVVVQVKENPLLTELYFDGHEHIKTDKLQEKVTVRTNAFLNQNQVEESVDTLRTLYRDEGYYAAKVIPVIQSLGSDKASLTFFVKEGPLARVRVVDFEGNHSIPSKELRDVVVTRKYKFLTSWLTGTGTYKKDEIPNDIERIREYYSNKGYLNVQVGNPEVVLSEDKKSFHITFPISEGSQYRIGTIQFTGNEEFTDTELSAGIQATTDDVFQRKVIREEIERMMDTYGAKGYVFAEAKPVIVPDDETHTADITFSITEGDLVKVRRINISGNDKTRDKVIRREVRVPEGEVVETGAIKRSFQRLQNLNFFESVDIVPDRVDTGEVDLNINVKEKATGSFSIGGGFSSLDRLTALFDVVEGNLFGRGQLLRLRAQIGQRRNFGNISFREPYLFDQEIAGQFDLFSQVFDVFTYEESRTGGGVTVSQAVGEFLNVGVNVVFEEIKVKESDVPFFVATDPVTGQVAIDPQTGQLIPADANDPNAVPNTDFLPRFIIDQRGTSTTSSVGFSVTRDTRDFFLDPSKGSRQTFSVEFASDLLGGSNNFYKILTSTSHFFPLWRDHKLSARGTFAIGRPYGSSDDLPVNERLFVGSINGFPQVRGFGYGKAGPTALVRGDLEPVGAESALGFTLEYIIPIVKEAQINAVPFVDLGRGFSRGEGIDPFDLRQTTGLELRWVSPFGPLRVAYGFKLDRQDLESPGLLEFSIGSLF